jgi:hypothetical protein
MTGGGGSRTLALTDRGGGGDSSMASNESSGESNPLSLEEALAAFGFESAEAFFEWGASATPAPLEFHGSLLASVMDG